MNTQAATATAWSDRWQRFSAAALRAYHAYGSWLVNISWKRFIVLALLLLIVVGILHDLPPFTWTFTEEVKTERPRVLVTPPAPPKPVAAPRAPKVPKASESPIRIETPGKGGADTGVEISIGKDGIRISPRASPPAQAASAAEAAADHARQAADAAASAVRGLNIQLPPGEMSDAVRAAIAEAKREVEQALREAREDAEQAARDAAEARVEAQRAVADALNDAPRSRKRTTRIGIGDVMMQFALLWIVASAILKFTYKGRMQAEVQAKKASATAEAESLKRQVVEARMAAMQAQVEPHFLFNTLASIDHLIETDPARASVMQKNLIALLRASMPTMREASGNGHSGVRDLGRELAVIRPYLEILKVRMEERLSTEIAVPEGLLSAEFPPMMIQTLVENAIKHGLEPKPEGGSLRLAAEIVHGKLQVTVADTGLGFGKAATAGTGVGLANIRERLQLLYGPKAALTVAESQPSGTVVTITVPYKTVEGTA
ncbi:MAG: histidine kinase [Rubrivivax sp.]|nr:histidine kinase [Rubrivivax sp.]